jgi:hypothetical protein
MLHLHEQILSICSNEYRVPIPIEQSDVDGRHCFYEYIDGKVSADNDTWHLFDEKELISLAKCIWKYDRFWMTYSPSLRTNQRSATREHLLEELKQADGRFLNSFAFSKDIFKIVFHSSIFFFYFVNNK